MDFFRACLPQKLNNPSAGCPPDDRIVNQHYTLFPDNISDSG